MILSQQSQPEFQLEGGGPYERWMEQVVQRARLNSQFVVEEISVDSMDTGMAYLDSYSIVYRLPPGRRHDFFGLSRVEIILSADSVYKSQETGDLFLFNPY